MSWPIAGPLLVCGVVSDKPLGGSAGRLLGLSKGSNLGEIRLSIEGFLGEPPGLPLLRSPLSGPMAESKKPWVSGVVTSRIKMAITFPGFARTTSV